ncbi:hypothetical protein RSAG8_04556, partial [Rhizoctonia solani AG-8 WAC10335]
MMGLLSGLQGGANSVRKRVAGGGDQDRAPEGSNPDDTSILDENEGSIVMSIISQLRIGMDLQRVAFPTFVLEPRSMLERITDFMSHPDLIFGAENDPQPEERFIRVLRYYLSGWHIKPKGVKKPYNPDGEYVISMPNMYARGILFGRMVLELGDMCTVKCEKTGMICDVEFKTKGFFSGAYNAVSGRVKQGNTDIAEVSGFWSSSMEYKSLKNNEKRVLFDAAKEKIVEKFVYPEEEQEPNESQRLWTKLTDAIHHKDMEAATDAKSAVENAQREAARKREETGMKHVPRFFEQNKAGQWVPKILGGIPPHSDAAVKYVQEWIW